MGCKNPHHTEKSKKKSEGGRKKKRRSKKTRGKKQGPRCVGGGYSRKGRGGRKE